VDGVQYRELEPTTANLGGTTLAACVRRLLLATRPAFYTASVLPVLVGTAFGARASGALDLPVLCLALLAVVLVHGAANVLNDVYDDISGADVDNPGRVHPYTGGSRFIQNGIMEREDMRRLGLALLAAALAPGAALVWLAGPAVLAFGLAGMALGALYSLPPASLSARGLGEAAVALAFGVLPVTGAAWLQSGTVDAGALLASLPVTLWVAAILIANEVPDARADASAGKRTLVVRLGLVATRQLYLAVLWLGLCAVAGAVLFAGLSPLALVVPVALAPAWLRAAGALGDPHASPRRTRASLKATLANHALGSIWLAGWCWPW
jgi:1,4-dihydroxy-2-naphthoate octaprenyltransferase